MYPVSCTLFDNSCTTFSPTLVYIVFFLSTVKQYLHEIHRYIYVSVLLYMEYMIYCCIVLHYVIGEIYVSEVAQKGFTHTFKHGQKFARYYYEYWL